MVMYNMSNEGGSSPPPRSSGCSSGRMHTWVSHPIGPWVVCALGQWNSRYLRASAFREAEIAARFHLRGSFEAAFRGAGAGREESLIRGALESVVAGRVWRGHHKRPLALALGECVVRNLGSPCRLYDRLPRASLAPAEPHGAA